MSSGKSYITLESSLVKELAQERMQSILDERAKRKHQWILGDYDTYIRWKKWLPFLKYKSFEEFKNNFNPDNMSLVQSMSYYTYIAYGWGTMETLEALLGLCQLNPNGEIMVSSDDVSSLGYPTKTFIPLPTEEKERLVAEQELQQALA